MNDLIEIYRRIEYLRNNGLKMKEIADYVDMAPSVLSALYSSVLPTYVTSLKQGHSEEDSLDLALAQVNNVSKNVCWAIWQVSKSCFSVWNLPMVRQRPILLWR